ncbi:TetR/AcrR family transcriptional regulator [Aquirufa sp. ROCK2-A2]
MGIQERKEKQKLEIRNAILEASIKLFKEEGFDNVSIRKIAEIIQYSPTTIYLYFKDKKEILYVLCEQGFEMIFQFTDTLNEIKDPLKKLHKMGEFYILFGLNYPEYYDLMLIQEAPMIHHADLQLQDWQGANKVFNRLKEIVQECIEEGKIPSGDVDLISITLWSTLHGLISLNVRMRLEKLVPKETIQQTMNNSLNWIIESLITKNTK